MLLRQQPGWTIDAVADACGFANRQGFSRAFKKENGCTPSDWLSQQSTPAPNTNTNNT